MRNKNTYWYRSYKLSDSKKQRTPWARCTVESYQHIREFGPQFGPDYFEVYKTDGDRPND